MLKRFASIRVAHKTQGVPSLGLKLCAVLMLLHAVAQHCCVPRMSTPAADSGDAYIAEVLAAMERRPNVTAKLRHESRLGDETLWAPATSGSSAPDHSELTRWEMQTPARRQSLLAMCKCSMAAICGPTATCPVADKSIDSMWGISKRACEAAPPCRQSDVAGKTCSASAEFRGGMSQMLADLLRRYPFRSTTPDSNSMALPSKP